MTINLRDTVRTILANTTNVDPYSITTQTLAAIPTNQRAEAFEQALPAFIRSMIVETRPIKSRPATATADTSTRPAGAVLSPRVAAIREDWRKHLDAIYSTATGNKRLSDFTHDDLIAKAEELAEIARANAVKSGHFERVAVAVSEAGVETVGELPESTLSYLFG